MNNYIQFFLNNINKDTQALNFYFVLLQINQ